MTASRLAHREAHTGARQPRGHHPTQLLDRIAELEAALGDLDPTHPLLWRIPAAALPTGGDPMGIPTPPPMA